MVNYDKMTTTELQEALEKLAAERIEKRGTTGRVGGEEQTAKSEFMYRLKEAEQIAALQKEKDDLMVQMEKNPDGKGSGQGQTGSLRIIEDKLATLRQQSDVDNRDIKDNSDVATDSNQAAAGLGTLVASAGNVTLGLLSKSEGAKQKPSSKSNDYSLDTKDEISGMQSMVGMKKEDQDGKMGPKTYQAIRFAEKILGLKETGKPSVELHSAIVDHVMKTGEHMGDTVAKYKAESKIALSALGEGQIKDIQSSIAMRTGHGANLGGVDGKVSGKLVDAVKNVERDNGLVPDGLIDKKLLQALGITGGEVAAFFPSQETPDKTVASKGKISK